MEFKMVNFQVTLFLQGWLWASCHAQSTRIVGGGCEGCEALHEYEDKKLTSTDTLPEFENNEPQLKITGTVYKKGGKKPAEGVIFYIYHTNRNGIYEKKVMKRVEPADMAISEDG